MLKMLKYFQNSSGFDTEDDKTYPGFSHVAASLQYLGDTLTLKSMNNILSSMFLIKKHQQGHTLKSWNQNSKFASSIWKSLNNK